MGVWVLCEYCLDHQRRVDFRDVECDRRDADTTWYLRDCFDHRDGGGCQCVGVERIREELRKGKNPVKAIELGYEKAFSAIIDANITTLIAAVILLVFGVGACEGFRDTLGLGIVTSVFTAIWVTRMLISIWVGRKRPKPSKYRSNDMRLNWFQRVQTSISLA